MTGRIWHTTETAADHAGCHTVTVRRALESGELHGFQRTTGGRWRIHTDCLDAWISSGPCPHQRPEATVVRLPRQQTRAG